MSTKFRKMLAATATTLLLVTGAVVAATPADAATTPHSSTSAVSVAQAVSGGSINVAANPVVVAGPIAVRSAGIPWGNVVRTVGSWVECQSIAGGLAFLYFPALVYCQQYRPNAFVVIVIR